MLWTYADAPRRRHLQARRRRHATTPRRTPGGRAPSTPTTSPAPRSSTCGTGSRPAHARAAQRRVQMLRGLTYLQTATGPNAGNVGALDAARRHAEPQRRPGGAARPVRQRRVLLARPHRSGRSARATPRSRHGDPAFAAFLRDRLDLSVARARRGRCSTRYGSYLHDRRPPHAGLADRRRRRRHRRGHARAGGLRPGRRPVDAPARAAPARRRASPSCPAATRAPGPSAACCPWALSRSDWHAWALADAGRAGPRRRPRSATARCAPPRRRDSVTFDPWLLTSGGPDNGRLPTRHRRRADRLRRRLAAPVPARRPPTRPAGPACAGSPAMVGGLVLRRQPSGAADVRPGHRGHLRRHRRDGTVNHNSGAESTIHGLLTMLALDAHPASPGSPGPPPSRERVGTTTLQAEDATLSGGAHAVAPADAVDRRVAASAAPATSRCLTAAGHLHPARARRPALRHAGGRPAARQHGGHHLQRRWHGARHASAPATSARRVTPRHPVRCCR